MLRQYEEHEHGIDADREDAPGVEYVEPLRPLEEAREEPKRDLNAERDDCDNRRDLRGPLLERPEGDHVG